MIALKPAAPTLPAVATEVLTSIYQHRLLNTTQVHAMHLPSHTRRWAEQILTQLARREMTAFVRPGRGGPRLYYLTPAGAQAVETIPTRVETRRKLITPEQAAGPLWRHTLAVNDTGIAFMRAARERDDDFGALGWRHEIAHHAPAAGHSRGELLIADALLTYLAHGPEGQLTFHYRLLELDRATVPADTLAAKLARYADLYPRPCQPRPAVRQARVAGALPDLPRHHLRPRRQAPARPATPRADRPRALPSRPPATGHTRGPNLSRAARRPPDSRAVRRDLAPAPAPHPTPRLAR